MNPSRKVTYRAGLFDPKNLISPAKIVEALNEFSAVINHNNYAGVLQDLLDKSHITELVLSGMFVASIAVIVLNALDRDERGNSIGCLDSR